MRLLQVRQDESKSDQLFGYADGKAEEKLKNEFKVYKTVKVLVSVSCWWMGINGTEQI